MKVDVHAHWFPPAYKAEFDRLSGRATWLEHPPELDDRVAALEAAGIDVQVLGTGHLQPHFADAGASAECARFANELYAQAVRDHDGRFAAFGAVPLPHVEAAVAEAAHCLDELGFAGIGVGTTAAGRCLDEPELDPFWAELNRRGTVVYVHPVGTPDTVGTGLGGYFLGPNFGGPAEAGIAAARLALSGLTTRFPRIAFVHAVMGGTLPWLWRRFEQNAPFALKTGLLRPGTDDPRGELLRMRYDTTLTDDPGAIAFAARTFGARALLFGTDAPQGVPAAVIATLEAVPELREALPAVLGETAAELLGLRR